MLALFAFSASQAQYTKLRTDKNSVLIRTTDAAGRDTIKITPTEWETVIAPASVTDSVVYVVKSTKGSYLGDKMICTFTNSSGSGHFVRFPVAYFATTGGDSTVALTSVKRATISFVFDGTKWVQTSIIKQ